MVPLLGGGGGGGLKQMLKMAGSMINDVDDWDLKGMMTTEEVKKTGLRG